MLICGRLGTPEFSMLTVDGQKETVPRSSEWPVPTLLPPKNYCVSKSYLQDLSVGCCCKSTMNVAAEAFTSVPQVCGGCVGEPCIDPGLLMHPTPTPRSLCKISLFRTRPIQGLM